MKKRLDKKNILYTGRGDNGTTTLFHCDQGRISKSANIIEALGSLDELNAYLGIAKVNCINDSIVLKIGNKNIKLEKIILNIQNNLFMIQAEVAGSQIFVKNKDVKYLEALIGKIGEMLSPIKSFTISGGSLASASLDYARTLARRAERMLVRVEDEGYKKLKPNTIAYMNRLSSILFALSRYVNYNLSIIEEHPKY